MKLELSEIKFTTKLPELAKSMSAFVLHNPSFEDRKKTIEFFWDILGLKEMIQVEVQDSFHLVSEKGEIQYYRPSGALWMCNNAIDEKYEDERRDWEVEKSENPEDPKSVILVLNKEDQKRIEEASTRLFREVDLLPKEAHFGMVDLDQVAQLDEKGNEIGKFAGEANAKFLYEMEGVPVDGPGAKTYAFYNPGDRTPELTGAFHSWREVADTRKIKLPKIEEALEKTLCLDPELILYKEKKHDIEISELSIVYFSMPPFLHQKYLFPAIHVTGFVSQKSENGGREGFEFARYYHAAPPKSYVQADMYADYLTNRI